MNKNRLCLAAALALSLSWAGCNKSEKTGESSGSAAPGGPVELKLKWTEGESIAQSMEMKQHAEIALPNQPAPMKNEMTIGQDYGLTVLKALPDGGHEIEMEFQGARMKMAMGGKTMMEYDSAKKQSSDAPDPVGGVYGKLVGAKIRYFLDASNNVDHLEGMNELIDRLTSSADNAAAMAPIKSMFNEDYFKQMMSQNRFLPGKPVQPGDTWPVELEMPMGPMGTLVMNNTFTFQNMEMHGTRHCARLNFKGTMKAKPAAKPGPEGMSISSVDGTTSGTSWFDPALGMIVDNAMNQDMTMVMTMAMGTMTNHMLQDVSIKVVSVK